MPQYAVNGQLPPSYVVLAEEKLDFKFRIQEIWEKVQLLEHVGYIDNETEKFNAAYRFTVMQLEQVCEENVELRSRLVQR
jgi:hypothetical protein